MCIENYDITLSGDTPVRIYGNVTDLIHALEALLPYVFKHEYSEEGETQAVADKINSYMTINVKASNITLIGSISGTMSATTNKNSYGSTSNRSYTYNVDLKMKSGILSLSLETLLGFAGIDIPPTDPIALTIDSAHRAEIVDITMEQDKITAHCDVWKTEDDVESDYADIDVTLTPAAIDGYSTALETLKVDFTATLTGTTKKLVGTCSNVHDAVIAAVVAAGNQHFKTESEAQSYADAVNAKVTATYTDDGIDQGPIQACVRYDETFQNYYVYFESSLVLE